MATVLRSKQNLKKYDDKNEIIPVQAVNMITTDTVSSLATKQPKCSSYCYNSAKAIKAEEAKTVLDKALDFKTAAFGFYKTLMAVLEREWNFVAYLKMGPAIFHELAQRLTPTLTK